MTNTQTIRIVLAVVATLVLVTIAGGCGRATKAAKAGKEAARIAQDAKDGEVTIKGEEGEEITVKTEEGEDDETVSITATDEEGQTTTSEFGADKVSEEDVGLKFYPGAEIQGGGKMTTTGDEGGSFAVVSLETKDPFDKVAKFYKDEYAKGNTIFEQPNQLMISIEGGGNAGKTIVVSRDEDSDVTEIALQAAASM